MKPFPKPPSIPDVFGKLPPAPKQPITVPHPAEFYNHLAWEKEVGDIAAFLYGIIGVKVFFSTSAERQTGVFVHALARHGDLVWCRTESGEIITAVANELHSLP